VEEEVVFRRIVKRGKEWDSLDMIPMKVRDEDMGVERLAGELLG
jgi:hypothetical protein